ncbi:metalloregulator ArsR/SmtB family transcription factor [Bacillus sp. AFS055030]|uniref:ArsR/SmtB family transcription factor n=1 Tax=Bacillus sp. AFS055030 TaxID=2033507 RepID=UPI000BFD35E1|nr:metalloregulator ArsR/SmtB family transcription factor [Bacillus sp. AFS055030]PGL73076.1 transcriptional regulator [Bacillus sp. AFS055030]
MSNSAQKYDVFQAIADPTRREVLKLLANNELPISEISSNFPMSRTAIAKHLHILSEAELISGRKVGRERRYKLQPDAFLEIKQWLSYYEQFWTNKLSILQHLVENKEEQSIKLVKSTIDSSKE